jgi:hypothetical protein
MFRNTKQLADHELRLATLSLAVAELRKQQDRSTPSEIFKLIEALQQDIDSVRISLRSLHGKVAIQKRYASAQPQASTDDEQEVDPWLALQTSHNGHGGT